MIATAITIGIKKGWLPRAEYRPVVRRAWEAVNARVDEQGRIMNVCEGTGKQPTYQDYFKRIANYDIDPRGGAMVMLLATELMTLE